MKKKNMFLVKFVVVAALVGFFSPSVSVKIITPSGNGFAAIPLALNISLFTQAEARRGGGMRRGGGARRGGLHRNRGMSGNRNINRNRNVNINRNVNVNVHHNNRYYGRGGYYGGRPLLAFGTGLAIGSMITAASMPSTCVTTYVNGINYRRCGSSYYQPFYEGTVVSYKVVNSPY